MNQGHKPLPYLETFSKAAELGSFTAAGDSLGMTQAAVSQRIRALEKDLGIALFQRRGGRVCLTEEGQQLYAHAQEILELHREARQKITGKKSPITGELLLAASSIPGEYLLPGIVAVFRKQYPGIQVRASQADSMDVLAQVERGKVHLGLVGRTNENTNLEVEPFAADEMVLVVPPGHRWKRRKQISTKQFRSEPLVIREPGSGSRWRLEQALVEQRVSLADLSVALELGSNEAVKEAVFNGVGVAVLSVLAVRKELEAEQLHRIRINELTLDRTMFVAWDKRRALPAPARLFKQFLQRCSSP
jgi:DNA-binding transcriptional LysR family regulator